MVIQGVLTLKEGLLSDREVQWHRQDLDVRLSECLVAYTWAIPCAGVQCPGHGVVLMGFHLGSLLDDLLAVNMIASCCFLTHVAPFVKSASAINFQRKD